MRLGLKHQANSPGWKGEYWQKLTVLIILCQLSMYDRTLEWSYIDCKKFSKEQFMS